MIPPADPLTALIAQWRKEAATWLYGIGANQNTYLYSKCADDLESLLGSLRGREGPQEQEKHDELTRVDGSTCLDGQRATASKNRLVP